MIRRISALFLAGSACLVLVGCGGGPRLAPVSGKLTFKGEPVGAGSLTFAPKAPPDQTIAGRPASGTPDEKGEFQLSTYKLNDGALVGEHYVTYSPPQPPETADPVQRDKEMKLFKRFGRCMLPENHVVEIKPGQNEIQLELVLAPKKTVE